MGSILKYKQTFIYAFMAILAALAGWKIVKFIKDAKDAGKDAADKVKDNATANAIDTALSSNGVSASSVSGKNVVMVADDIYDAIHKDVWFGWGEDEQKAIDSFNSLASVHEAVACASVYKAQYKKSLYNDLDSACSVLQFQKLKTSFINAIKKY